MCRMQVSKPPPTLRRSTETCHGPSCLSMQTPDSYWSWPRSWRKLSLWMFLVVEDFWSSSCLHLKAKAHTSTELQVSHLCPTLGFRIPPWSFLSTGKHLAFVHLPGRLGYYLKLNRSLGYENPFDTIPCPSYSLVHNAFPSPPPYTYLLNKHWLSIRYWEQNVPVQQNLGLQDFLTQEKTVNKWYHQHVACSSLE